MKLAEVLRQRVWIKESLGNDTENTACIAGALGIAMYGSITALYNTILKFKEGPVSTYYLELAKLDEIAGRLFPERIMSRPARYKSVEVNNHEDTTLDQILKIAEEYDREVENR